MREETSMRSTIPAAAKPSASWAQPAAKPPAFWATPGGTMGALALAACGGQEPPPHPPPPPAPPPATASAAPMPVDTSPPPPPKPSLAELIPQTLKGIDEAFNAHDAKKLATFYTEDCVASAYGEPEAHGRDDISKGMDALFSTFNDAKSAPAR